MNRVGTGRPEMWGGLECTVNRVGDRYFDQLDRNGHCSRLDDIELFGGLGLQAIRYPLLWERLAPHERSVSDWSWADARMARLERGPMRPIVGLVHHGSGPRHTSLLDESFATGLASFAGAVARRYPWVQEYTPINEPLTTARFSGLYGFWYPHHRDFRSFVRALLVQCRAVALSMQAIRDVNPAARLIQTEDVGRTFSTRVLAYQATYENERRWLSLDLLCGRMTPAHPWWRKLLDGGATAAELDWFASRPAPDVIGLNYYLTSDRVLDHRLTEYPPHTWGGNGRHEYADVEAVRASATGIVGHLPLLREAWSRYRIPLAITEVQAGATREDQLRWLDEAWRAAVRAREEGIDVRAVTAWSLLGSWDWHVQVTRDEGVYESGVFDTRSVPPRPTALARMASDLARQGRHEHPVLADPGWWRRPARRFVHTTRVRRVRADETRGVPILIAGGSGALARAIARACVDRGLSHCLLQRQQLDIADPRSVAAALERTAAWAVVNAAGFVRVDEAEGDVPRCLRENTAGPAVLAAACSARGLPLLTFSSDLVFDGSVRRPYVESDPVRPLNAYGASKARAEMQVLVRYASALIVRTSAFFGTEARDFLTAALDCFRTGRPFRAASDVVVSPTYVPDLAEACLDLLIDGEQGVWHLANRGSVTWADLARGAAMRLGLPGALVQPCRFRDLGLPAARPAYSALGTERGSLLPDLQDALDRWARTVADPVDDGVGEVPTVDSGDSVPEGDSSCTTT